MGYGISIWRLTPKINKLKPYEKECKLCTKKALEEDDFCEDCLKLKR